MDVYGELARFYDGIYSDTYDLEFYLREARNARGPVLEIACGTGRILLRLLKEGIDITGLDFSPDMLAILKSKASALGLKPDVGIADMRDFSLNRKFRLIILPYRSFLHLQNDDDRRKALGSFLKHLEPGGKLILHTYNPSKEELGMTGRHHHFDSETLSRPDGTPYRLDWFLKYDPEQRIGHYRIIRHEEGAGHKFEMSLSWLPVKELRALLASCGYRNINLYCGFSYGSFSEKSREAIWIAEK